MPRTSQPITRPRWIPASWIMEATGWDKEKMRRAREQGVVDFKRERGIYLYNINSIHPALLKKLETQTA